MLSAFVFIITIGCVLCDGLQLTGCLLIVYVLLLICIM